MARNLLAVLLLLGVSPAVAFAAGPQGIDALMRHYDASAVAEGKIQVSTSGDVAYVSGTSADGPWLEVWRRAAGEWKMVAELVRTGLTPIRFGAKRDRSCRRTS
jgi:ketosteroid isomerase-like protein